MSVKKILTVLNNLVRFGSSEADIRITVRDHFCTDQIEYRSNPKEEMSLICGSCGTKIIMKPPQFEGDTGSMVEMQIRISCRKCADQWIIIYSFSKV